MRRRKRSTTPLNEGNFKKPGLSRSGNQNENSNKVPVPSVEIDLTDDDDLDERQAIPLPKKTKMEADVEEWFGNVKAGNRNGKPLPVNGPSASSSKSKNNNSEEFLSARSNPSSSNNGNGEFFTAPHATSPHTFKVPLGLPSSRGKKTEVPQATAGPSSSAMLKPSSLGNVMGGNTKDKRSNKPEEIIEKESKATAESRKLRAAIVGAFQEELEKASKNDLKEINIDSLMNNLQTCIKVWPNIYVRMRNSQVHESEDRSDEWEIVEFCRWWLFGLTGLFFASPAMRKPEIREKIKVLIRTLCQLLCNGHPTLLDAFIPQFLGIMRDLTVRDGTDSTSTITINLPHTKLEEDNKTTTQYTYCIKITEKDEWAIPHYLEAVSILFPKIFSYNHLLRHVLVELLKRLSTRLPPVSYALVMISTLQNALTPSLGYLTEKAIAEMIYEMLKITCTSEAHRNEMKKLFNRFELSSLSVLSSGTTMVALESAGLLYSEECARMFSNDADQPLSNCFEFLLNEMLTRKTNLSTDLNKALSKWPSTGATLNAIIHPLVKKVIVKELLAAQPPPSTQHSDSPVINKASDMSKLWSRIIGCWEEALKSNVALIHPSHGQDVKDSELVNVVHFLRNTAALVSLIQNTTTSLSQSRSGKYQFFEVTHLQSWRDVACFALLHMSRLMAAEKHRLYISILDTIVHLDACFWFMSKLSAKGVNIMLCIAGWPWLNEFDSQIPQKLKPLPAFTRDSANLDFIKSSEILMAKAVGTLRLAIFRPWKSFVVKVFASLMSAPSTYDSVFLLAELLSSITNVSWPLKELPLHSTFSFLIRVLQTDIWKVESHITSEIGNAIASLPCICCYYLQAVYLAGTTGSSLPLKSGCQNCAAGKYLDSGLDELTPQLTQKIIALALPILQSTVLPAKFNLVQLVKRCNHHMKNPTAWVAIPLIDVAVKGKSILCEAIFKQFGILLAENNSKNLESGCPVRVEVAQRIFRVVLPQLCAKLVRESGKSKLPLKIQMKILFGIQELSTISSISMAVFLEIINFLLQILSYLGNGVALLCQKIVANFSEMYRCAPHELITRVRSEISRQFVRVTIKQFYLPSAEPEIEERKSQQCSKNIEYLRSIGGFSLRNTFARYYYPSFMEQIVPSLHANEGYQFFLSALTKHADYGPKIMLQETITMWYPKLLLDHSSDTVTQCLKFLLKEYGFDAVFIAKQQEQRILNEALCRLVDRKDQVLRFMSHLCKWDDSSSQQVFSQGTSKSLSRSEIQELMDKRMLGFFLHLDTKVKSRIETVETKKRTLKSFVALMTLMGKSKMTPLRTKAYQTLNTVTELGPNFHDVVYDAWRTFAANLDNESFASMTCPILAAILPLRETPSMRPNVDALVSHFVCYKGELTSIHHPKLYFLLDQCDDQDAKTIINAAVSTMKANSWFDYFNMLVEEAGHSNSHIRYQAFRKLNEVFDQEATNVEKYVLAKGQQNVSRLISTLLAGLRAAAGGKLGCEKMRLVITTCFGNLGALDPFRFRNGDDERCSASSIKGTCLVVSAHINTFCLLYVKELLREFRDAEDATIFDYCVCLIRNLFQDFNVKVSDKDPIWSKLSRETQEDITPMLTTKYVMDVEEKLPIFHCPIYLSEHGKRFDEWLLNWLTVLIKCIKKSEGHAYSLFVKNMNLLRKNARIAAFIIPFVALHAIFCADSEQMDPIIAEMKNILERWTVLEKRKAENSEAVKDSEAEMDILEEPMSVENESVFHFRCTQIIFSVLDHLLRSLIFAERMATRKREDERSSRRPGYDFSRAQQSEIMTPDNVNKIKMVLNQIPQILMSQVAFDSQSSATALFYIEQELKANPSNKKFQKHLDYLQRIYVSLNDMDSVRGISAVREIEPSSHERVLENIAEGKVGDYIKSIELMTEHDPLNLTANYALVQAYLSVDEPKAAEKNVLALLVKHPEWEVAVKDVQMDALVKLKSWDDLNSEVCRLESFSDNPVMAEMSLTWSVAVSRTISKIQTHQFSKANEIVNILRGGLVAPLVAAAEEMHPYKRAYDTVVQLHILAEIQDVIALMIKHTSSGRERVNVLYSDVKAMLANWDSRLTNVSKSRKTLDQILNVRKSVFEIMKTTFQSRRNLCDILNASIRECWLDIAKDSSKCANFIRADKALLEAKQFDSPKVFIQEAKILARKGNKETAVSVLQKGIAQHFQQRYSYMNQRPRDYDPQTLEHRTLCSKSLLLLAKFCEEQKLLDKQDYIDKYKEAIDVYETSEKNYFTLGSYFDRLWNKEKTNCDLQVKVCSFYSMSLLYGCKYVYQSLPRLLSIWFDHAASVNGGEVNKSTTTKVPRSFGSSSSSPDVISPLEALNQMESSIKRMIGNVPPYVLMTAFSQLISRLCHSHASTWAILKNIIVIIMKSHPHQTLWMTQAVLHSLNNTRKFRCREIYKIVAERARPDLQSTIKDYKALTVEFLGLCDKQINKENTKASLNRIYERLPKFIRQMGKVLIPFQLFMNPSLPQIGISHKEHDPYPEPPVYIADIDDTVEIMTSLIRPKKITLIASNGKRYGILCKPKDDLRKDSKVMEVNNVVNWYLRQNTEASDRRLHVRTYSVVPLNEECGLLEWVPNLQPMRFILLSLYREKGISMPNRRDAISKHDSPEEKQRKFQEKFLMPIPPVFSDWFFNNFNDHQSWYAARMSYTRTAAVMSIVGYIMGLGDRHGENLLLDSVTGEIVHVDFNCLFNKGEGFEYPEKVPFRLTQNMVDAMGPLGYEGVFRRTCEITMGVFRAHQNVFLSVFRPFVYDPLVEWHKKSNVATLETGETNNEKAVDTMNYILRRLNGTGRNEMKVVDTELSVEAQVKYLIEEATSLDNLSQMYIGWAAYM